MASATARSLSLRRLRSLATGITLVSIVVAFIAIAIIVVGVLVVAQSTFNRLMVQAGTPAADAQAMFDHGVATIFLIAVLIAVAISVALAVILAARLAMPLRHMAHAAERIAAGDYEARVAKAGPEAGSSGYVRRSKIPSEPSAPSVASETTGLG